MGSDPSSALSSGDLSIRPVSEGLETGPLVLRSPALGTGKKRGFPACRLQCSKRGGGGRGRGGGGSRCGSGTGGQKARTKLAKLHQKGTKDKQGSSQQASKYRAAAPRQEQAISLPMSSFPACTIPPLTLWIDPLLHFRVAKGGEEQKNQWTPRGPSTTWRKRVTQSTAGDQDGL